MARLWSYVNGEPFMINPRVGILNPKKRGSKMAYRKRKRATVGSVRRKRTTKRRRNSWMTGGRVVPVANPRRRRRSTRRSVRRARRRSTVLRNPRLFGVSLPPLSNVIYGGIGFAAPPMVEGFLSRFLPAELSASTLGKYAIRIGSVLGLGWAARQFIGVRESNSVMIGGTIYVAVSAVQEFAPGMLPGMGAYVPLGAYVPALGSAEPTPAPRPVAALPAVYESSAAFFPQTDSEEGIAARFKRY